MSSTISGNVGGVSGVLVSYTSLVSGSGSTTTDANGNYTLSGLANDTYTITPSTPPVWHPPFITVTVSGGTTIENCFALGPVSGTVATLVPNPTNPIDPNTGLQKLSPYTGTIAYNTGTVVFFDNTDVVQLPGGIGSPLVGSTVQFYFEQIQTSSGQVGYVGHAVGVVVTP